MNDEINFEGYRRERARAYSPIVSITTSGAITFSSSFIRSSGLRDYGFVAFRFGKDDSHYYLGFSFSKVGMMEGVAKLYRPKRNGVVIDTAIATGKGFLTHYGVDPIKYKGHYNAYERNDPQFGKMYVVKIKK